MCRILIQASILAVALLAGAGARAVDVYPSRPIRIVAPEHAGDAPDVIARLVAEPPFVSARATSRCREPSRSGRSRRLRYRRQGGTGRLHAHHRQRGLARNQRRVYSKLPLRHSARLHPGLSDRDRAQHHGHQSGPSGDQRSAVHCLRQGASRSFELRIGRQWKQLAHVDGAVQIHGRDRSSARTVQGVRHLH